MKENKKEMQRQFNRDRISDIAEKLFFQKGYEHTSADDIAREAQYSKSTMYVYFKSKEEIYNSIILKGMSLLKEEFESVISLDKPFFEKYYAICDVLVKMSETYPIRFNGILGNISLDFSDVEKGGILLEIFSEGEKVNLIIEKLLAEGMSLGILKSDLKIKETIFILWAGLSGVVQVSLSKVDYIENVIKTSKVEFLKYAFDMLLGSIKARQ